MVPCAFELLSYVLKAFCIRLEYACGEGDHLPNSERIQGMNMYVLGHVYIYIVPAHLGFEYDLNPCWVHCAGTLCNRIPSLVHESLAFPLPHEYLKNLMETSESNLKN